MRFIRRYWKRALGAVLVLVIAALAYVYWPITQDLSALRHAGDAYHARILRDTWGVPHIFGHTDADAAYGLAYAHAEDDFLTIQQTLVAARGKLATVYGKDAAPNDYMVQLLRIWEVVDEKYDSLAPETRAVVEAYAAGLNVYAALHPQEALPGLFPVSGKDVVAGSVHKSPLFFGLEKTLAELFADTRQNVISVKPTLTPAPPLNSNTFAVAPARSSDGSTFLAINSHQPWTGPVAWYEATIHSDEGWDAAGALFPGSPVIIHGHNRNLGWAFTVNHPDLVDVFVLDINPANADQYRFNGQWWTLEKRAAPITVKLLGNFRWTVTQEVLWSVYGPVIRQKHGTYAVRYAGMGTVGIWEQLYRMNKAQNFDEWLSAVKLQQMPTFNIGYADKDGNIYYLYNGLLPVRAEGYDWSQYLPGDTSETMWQDTVPFEQLPQVLNPPSGFIQNANSSPYSTTVGAGNPNPADFSPTLGIETRLSNRSLRLRELLGADESITADDFYNIKYDLTYAAASDVALFRQRLLALPAPADPDAQAALPVLRAWDLRATPESSGTALMVLTLAHLDSAGAINASLLTDNEVEDALLMDSFVKAAQSLKKNFGRVDVAWAEVNRLRRGAVDVGVGGGPDTVRAIYGALEDDGRLKGFSGDSYVMLVRWDAAGNVTSQSIHQFGAATLNEQSPHYADQAPLFAHTEMKPVWLAEADLRAHLEREYAPGE